MSGTFQELTQDLSNDEKKSLLGRIQQSLNLSARDTDSIISKAEGPEELKHRLTKELGRLGVVERWFLRLAAFFRGRADYEVLGDRKLGSVRSVLRDRIPSLVSFSKGEWTPEFGKSLYDLYAEAVALKPVFDHLFVQKLTLEAGLVQLLREIYPSAIRTLQDIFPDREIAEFYRADQKRTAVQGQLDQRLDSYLAQIPSLVFEKLRDRLAPLYYLRPLVQYPYGFLFELFGHNPDKVEVSKYPYFLAAPWRKAAALLERLYYGIYLAGKVEWHEASLNVLFQGVVDRIRDDKTTWTVEILNLRIAGLVHIAQELARKIPWKETLQWSFQDPYYSVKYILPKFSVREFYQSSLQMSLREELDERIPRLRQDLLSEERSLLFQNGSFQPLDFYVPGVGASLGAQKIRGFQCPETLGLLWGFLNHHFTKKIQPFHQSLVRMVAPASKASLQGLNNVMEDLNGLKIRIQKFDRGLHPDSEEGKEFHKLKYELNTKALSLKPFLILVQNKDQQALEILNRGLEGIQILHNQLSGIRDRNVPALRAVLKLPYLLEGQQETIENGLDRLLVIVTKSLFVLREAQSLET